MLACYQATCNRGELLAPPLPEDTNHHGLTPLPPLPDEPELLGEVLVEESVDDGVGAGARHA